MSNMYFEHLPVKDFLSNEHALYKEKSFKELIVIEGDNSVTEVTKSYVECTICKYSIVPGFNSTSVDGFAITENICVVEGFVNLSIEFIMSNENSQLCVVNDSKNFSTFIMLPNEYVEGSDIVINCAADYISVNKVAPNQLFYFLHLILSFNIY